MPSKSEPSNSISSMELNGNIKIKEENDMKEDISEYFDEDYHSDNEKYEDSERPYPIDLPLEVITTIEPFNYAYPLLKNMSNGVLTHRNIFTEVEREVLRKIVERYRDIVDTRSRTREIYLEKQNVWQHIVEEYNGTENIMVRTEKELRKCWDNMKYRARQAVREQQKVENMSDAKSPDAHQIACNAVQVALEKMISVQNVSDDLPMPVSNEESPDDLYESKDHWHAYNSTEQNSSISDEDRNDFYGSSNQNPLKEEFDDDDQPVLKKARQESPKLSSLLLGENKRKSDYIGSNVTQYSIPNCTKVTHIKKKSKKSSQNPITILPKGLHSCVSIVNIPNPNQPNSDNMLDASFNESDIHSGTINLGGGVTISPQRPHSSLPSCNRAKNNLKPMPNLKKMVHLRKSGSKKSGKIINDDVNQFSKDIESPVLSINNNNNSHHHDIAMEQETNLESKVYSQRLDFEEKEHILRMKVLEKQLQAYSNESQYWGLKLKLLHDGQDQSYPKMVNGDCQIRL